MKASPAAAASLSTPGAIELHDAQLTQQLDAYYDRTRLVAVVQDFVRELTQRFATTRLVPMDVYAPLLAHFRLAEISAMELLVSPRPRDLKALAAAIPPQELLLFDPRDGRNVPMGQQVATFKAQPPPRLAVWGLRRVLERIPYSGEWQRSVEHKYELVAMWLGESETVDEACNVRCTGAVVGYEGFFTTSTQAQVAVEVERHVVVAGEQLEQAMTAFARQLIRSLFEATKKNAVVTLPGEAAKLTLVSVGAIQIANPKDPPQSRANNHQTAWTLESVTANRQAFVTAVKMALVANAVFLMDLLYEQTTTADRSIGTATDGNQPASSRIVRCGVSFFFHFDGDAQPQAGVVATKPKTAASLSTPSKSRSFVSQSRLHESGLFVSTRSAYELTRRFYDQQERDGDAGIPTPADIKDSTPQPPSPLEGLGIRLVEATRSSVETRHWLSLLSGSLVFRLARLLSLIDVMLHAVRVVVAEDDASIAALLFRLMESSIRLYEDTIQELLEDASVGRSSSLLKGLGGVIRDLCSLPHEEIRCEDVDAFYQQLQCSREAIYWIFSAASRDFYCLVTLTTNGETALAKSPSADLRADIAAAIEERCYPPAIVAETVFAQYLVNSRLDVALERSLVNTVASGLPPNPFVPFSGHLRVFAVQSILERSIQSSQAALPVEIKPVDGVGFLLQASGPPLRQLASANNRLLQHLNVAALTSIHSFLTDQQVYRVAPYNPSKASYSARIFASLMVDDPLLTVSEPLDEILLQQIEIVEHVVIEGSDHAQALWFFADAVRRDVQRLLTSQSSGVAQLALLDPNGDVLTMVELRDIQTFEQLLTEATPKQCTLQITLSPVVQGTQRPEQPLTPLVRLVTKSYLFHHISSASASSLISSLSPRAAFRLRAFAIFMDVDSARLVLASVSTAQASLCKLAHQMSYSYQAEVQNDRLRLEYLTWISSSPTTSYIVPDPPPGLLLRLLDVEMALRWLLDHALETSSQSAVGSSPRTAAVDAAAALCMTVLPRIVHNIKRLVLPVVENFGFVDISSINHTLASVGTLATRQITADAWVQMAEDYTRRLWVLLRLIRVGLHADTIDHHH